MTASLIASRPDLELELDELEAAARAWFDPSDADDELELARLAQVLAASSLVDIARPDAINLPLLRTLAQLPAEWDDAHSFAGVALAAIDTARDAGDDEGYGLRYLGAARDALRLAELADVERARIARLAEHKRAAAWEQLQEFAQAWRELGGLPWKQKIPKLGARLGLHDKSIERLHADAVEAGLPLESVDPRA